MTRIGTMIEKIENKPNDKWQHKVEAIIAERISRKATIPHREATITYKDMAVLAAIPAPHTIHKLTTFLEQLTERDIALGQPVRAAIVVSRTSGIPGEGFFIKLAELGLTPEDGEDAAAFHQRLMSQL
jgi:hypothetical protein